MYTSAKLSLGWTRVFGGRFEMPHLANIARDHKEQERSACVNEHESEV